MNFKWSLLLCCLMLVVGLSAQDYFIAEVKGDVLYDGKQLRAGRTIAFKKKLSFGNMDSHVALSGPGGYYRIQPDSMSRQRKDRFVVKLNRKVMPSERAAGTTPKRRPTKKGTHGWMFAKGVTPVVFEPYAYRLSQERLAQDETVGILVETNKGLRYLRSELQDTVLYLTQAMVDEVMPPESQLKHVAIVRVRDLIKWQQVVDLSPNLVAVQTKVDRYFANYYVDFQPSSIEYRLDPLTGKEVRVVVPPKEKAAEVLDVIPRIRFVDREAFKSDMALHKRWSGAKDVRTFLEDYHYGDYIKAKYGVPEGYENELHTVFTTY